jgi:monoamine oxidase
MDSIRLPWYPFGYVGCIAVLWEAQVKIGVVGAGISGLRVAQLLEEQGHDVSVFEARQRIGGRIYTTDLGSGAAYEAGGEWLDADQPRIRDLVEKYCGHLEAAEQEPALAIYKGEVRQTSELWEEAAEDEERFEHSARALARDLVLPVWKNLGAAKYDGLTLDSFLKQNCESEQGHWWLQANLRSDEGDDLDRIGLLGWLGGYVHYINRENLNRGESEMSAFRVPGGFSAMLEKMQLDLKGTVTLDSVLQRVVQTEDGVELRFENSAERFDRVVLTLPPACVERVVFEPALPVEKRCALEACGMSRAIKIVWRFSQAWWRDRGFCGRLHCDGPLHQLWEGTRGSEPILTAYICGERAVEWTRLGDPVSAGLYEIAQLFPEAPAFYVDGELHDWINDPYSLGAFSHHAPGFALEHAGNIATPEGKVHFAGEHTATWVGFIEGALESAERVAAEIDAL